jgi:hypothetical protein
MGRGHGATQRRLLERLRANTADPLEDQRARPAPPGFYEHEEQPAVARSWTRLVDMIVRNATPAAHESARRALYRLRQQGVVQTAYLTEAGRRYLAARITPSAEMHIPFDPDDDWEPCYYYCDPCVVEIRRCAGEADNHWLSQWN